MDDFLRWLPALMVLAGVLLTFGRGEQVQRFMRDELATLTRYVEEHRTEHRAIDKAITEHEGDLKHARERHEELRADVHRIGNGAARDSGARKEG